MRDTLNTGERNIFKKKKKVETRFETRTFPRDSRLAKSERERERDSILFKKERVGSEGIGSLVKEYLRGEKYRGTKDPHDSSRFTYARW